MRGQKGFTLVELLVAITIFAIGLIGLAAMQITSIRSNAAANIKSTATAAAQEVLEEVLARSGEDDEFDKDSLPTTETVEVGRAPAIYVVTYTITPSDPFVGVARLVAQVNSKWDNRNRLSMTAFKGGKGP